MIKYSVIYKTTLFCNVYYIIYVTLCVYISVHMVLLFYRNITLT